MTLRFISLILCISFISTAPLFKKLSLKDVCGQSLVLAERPSLYQRMCTVWGTQKKLERWEKVVDSVMRATKYCIDKTSAQQEGLYTVRVLLDEHTLKIDACSWELISSGGFIVINESIEQSAYLVTKPVLLVAFKKGALHVNGKRLKGSAVRIIAEQGTTMLDGTTYKGDFLFVRYKDRILCINCIELESYVGSVLSSESWPGWPLEVNKVFAIMCRSYVLSHMLTAQKSGRPYHVRNTNSHQNYHGVHTSSVIEDAVAQTAGICLVYNNRPVLAMFDACCGGVIPAYISHGIDFEKEPYLARAYACTYCKQCSLYSWEKTVSLTDLEKKLRAARLCNDTVHEVRVVARDKAGLAKTVHIKTKRGIVTCKGKQIYSALPEVKSYAFDTTKRGQNITITGYGHGHHLGVCQWGAREMVRLGYTYQQILSFYYPGTVLRSIK